MNIVNPTHPAVLMVCYGFPPVIGGSEKQAFNLSKKLSQNGVQVLVATAQLNKNLKRYEFINGIHIFRLFSPQIRFIRHLIFNAHLAYFLFKYRSFYDIIHIHILGEYAPLCAIMGKLLNKKTIVKIASSGVGSDFIDLKKRFFFSWFFPAVKYYDAYIATSDKIRHEIGSYGIPSSKIVNIPNGVDIGRFTFQRRRGNNPYFTFCFVGRLNEIKNLGTLVDGFSIAYEALKRVCNPKLILVGDGVQRKILLNKSRELHIEDSVLFPGDVADVRPYLQQSDVFVLPSWTEGLSNALLEAMACGLPVIVSNVGGNKEVITHKENGLLFNPGDPKNLANLMVEIVSNIELRQKIGHNARETIENEYDLNVIADHYYVLYRQLIGV